MNQKERNIQRKLRIFRRTDDVDLRIKLAEWESFYNLSRPVCGIGSYVTSLQHHS